MSETVLVEVDGRGVATVTLHRPEVKNAFNPTLIGELSAVAEDLAADPAVRVVVLTGSGDAFSAGADLNWMRSARDLTFEDDVAGAERMSAMFRTLWDLPKALIGRINGAAIAGASGLTAVCDAAIAVEGALFGFTEAAIGIAPAVISPYVVRVIGLASARRLFVTGERFDAAEALRIGLVSQVVAADELDAAVEAAVRRALSAAPGAAAVAKALPELALAPLDEATARMPAIIARLRAAPEGQEGMSAFLERRRPSWAPQS
jgi:methylglutaconyl-CoA hydratase